eukprot:1159310-Pelagomonas_calceolata.AAC.3
MSLFLKSFISLGNVLTCAACRSYGRLRRPHAQQPCAAQLLSCPQCALWRYAHRSPELRPGKFSACRKEGCSQ